MDSPDRVADVDLFCRERVDLELKAVSESAYYAALQKHYKPVRMLGWIVVALVAGSGIFAGLNTMYGAVVGRVRELATLQAIGFRRRAILLTLVQEATLLACAGALAGVRDWNCVCRWCRCPFYDGCLHAQGRQCWNCCRVWRCCVVGSSRRAPARIEGNETCRGRSDQGDLIGDI